MKQQKEEIDPDSITKSASVDVMIECAKWFDMEDALGGDLVIYIEHTCNKVLQYIGFTHCIQHAEITVLLDDDEELQRLNNDFRHKNKPTNVLSFPAQEIAPGAFTELILDDMPLFIGDIAISYQRIFEESVEQDMSFKEHFTHILVHSVLHLLGYDHMNENDATQMENLEISILAKMGFKNPYIIEHVTNTSCIKY